MHKKFHRATIDPSRVILTCPSSALPDCMCVSSLLRSPRIRHAYASSCLCRATHGDVLRIQDRSDDSTLSMLQQDLSAEFFELFHVGVTMYVAGDWHLAREYLLEGLHEQPFDGPTHHLLQFMARYNFQVPGDWAGARQEVLRI